MLLGKRDQDWFCSSLVFQLSWWLERRQTTVTIFGCPIDFATTVSKDNKLGLSFGIKSLHFHQGIAIVPFPIVLLSDMLCTPIFLPLYFRGKSMEIEFYFPLPQKAMWLQLQAASSPTSQVWREPSQPKLKAHRDVPWPSWYYYILFKADFLVAE